MRCLIFIAFFAISVVRSGMFKGLPKTIKSDKIIKLINDNPKSTWKVRNRELANGKVQQADNYGLHEIDVEQFARSRLGVKFSRKPRTPSRKIFVNNLRRTEQAEPVSAAAEETLPESFTWTDKNNTECSIDYIKDQSNCGSCWAIASVTALQDRFCIQSKGRINVSLSPGYVMSCNTENSGCNGGYMFAVYEFLVDEGAITGGDFESDLGCQTYPIRPCGSQRSNKMPCAYTAAMTPKCRGRTCNNDWYRYRSEPDGNVFKAQKYRYIPENEYSIREEIYKNGPVTAAFLVLDDFPFYKGGIYDPNGHYILGGHAVRVIGWGVENGVKYWLVANSWGRDWGENGYFRITRGNSPAWFEDFTMSPEPRLNNH